MPKKPKRVIVKRKRRRTREKRISEIGLQTYRDALRESDERIKRSYEVIFPKGHWHGLRTTLDDMLPPEPTINRIARPEPL